MANELLNILKVPSIPVKAFSRANDAVISVFTNSEILLHRKIILGLAQYAHLRTNWIFEFYTSADAAVKSRQRHAQGIITLIDTPKMAAKLAALGKPSVIIGDCCLGASGAIPRIEPDNNLIAKTAADHLLHRCCKSFAFFGAIPKIAWRAERRAAFLQHLLQDGHPRQTREFMPPMHETAPHQLYLHIGRWLKTMPPPIGVMAANDGSARLLLEACRLNGMKSPDDLLVVGVDDDEAICEFTAPPLTSVIQDTDRMGYEAARTLKRLMHGQTVKSVVRIPPRGIAIRRSTDLLAIAHPALRQILGIIEKRLDRVQPEDIAGQMAISRATLDKQAKKLINLTTHELIVTCRLRKVQELLARTNVPIKEIANRTGYSSSQYLGGIFRQYAGITPAEYRRRNSTTR